MAVVEGARVTHTTLEIRDVERSFRFYWDVMGIPTTRPPDMDKVCHIRPSNGVLAACVAVPRPTPQPLLNYFARPVRDAAAVDHAYERMQVVRDEYGIRQITAPAHEDPSQFGVGTYGFYVEDGDGNWWRVEENAGPFGPAELPADPLPADSVVPAGPLSYVVLESRALAHTVAFYREYLGVPVEQPAPHYCLSRNPNSLNFLTVEVGDRVLPQGVLNHIGLTLQVEPAEIDRLHAETQAQAKCFGIRKLMPATHQHGSYSFYLQDADTNWWEIEMKTTMVNRNQPVTAASRGQ